MTGNEREILAKLERIALAGERLVAEFCKPVQAKKRPARLSTATYTEEERNRESLRALASKGQAKRNTEAS